MRCRHWQSCRVLHFCTKFGTKISFVMLHYLWGEAFPRKPEQHCVFTKQQSMSIWSVSQFCSSVKQTSRQNRHAQLLSTYATHLPISLWGLPTLFFCLIIFDNNHFARRVAGGRDALVTSDNWRAVDTLCADVLCGSIVINYLLSRPHKHLSNTLLHKNQLLLGCITSMEHVRIAIIKKIKNFGKCEK